MATKIITLFTIIFIVLFNYSCRKKCVYIYSFNLPIQISASKDSLIVKDTLQIGDTLYLTVKTPSTLYNQAENESIDISARSIRFGVYIYKLDSSSFDKQIESNPSVVITNEGFTYLIDLTNRFNLISTSPYTKLYDTRFQCGLKSEFNSFSDSFSLSINQPGTYLMYFYDLDADYLISTWQSLDWANNDCHGYYLPFKYTINKQNNNYYIREHYNIGMELTGETTNGGVSLLDVYNYNLQYGTYCFVVRE